MLNLNTSLEPLKDVAGVEGSFIVSTSGEIVARDMPAIFHDEVLGEAAPRIQRLWDTLAQLEGASDGGPKSQCLLEFSDYHLYLREVLGGKLAILAQNAVNPPALRMAANLVVRQINSDIERARERQSRMPAVTAQANVPAPPAPAPASVAPSSEELASEKKGFVYRGRRYED